jgi:3-phosphoinositide dependent protein kinase-1
MSPPPEPDGTAIATAEWLETLVRARDLGYTQQSISGSYSGESAMELSSQMPSPAGSSLAGGDGSYMDADAALALEGVNVPSSTSRLRKEEDAESLRKGRKRFSRRQSKGGLAAVF